MSGTLFVVATPIGNLEDLTFRALRTLREVDLIAAEDTRRTSKLLAHYDIRKPLVSLREHNEVRESPRLVRRLEAGESIALVSDAGTPGIADPGSSLVTAARAAGIPVVAIPGVSAVAAAVSVSGLSGDSFTFYGFPPSSGAARQRWFDKVALDNEAVVFFESPHRIRRTIDELREYAVYRPTLVFRELTKINDELVVNPTGAELKEQGEFTVVVHPPIRHEPPELDKDELIDIFERLTKLAGLTEEDAERAVAALKGATVPAVQKALKKGRIARRRLEDSRP